MQLEEDNTLENRVVIGHGEEECRVLHPELVQQHNDIPKAIQQADNMQFYKGVVKSKWKPTSRNFTKNAGELMSNKVQESEGTLKKFNSFEVLDQPLMREVDIVASVQGGGVCVRSESIQESVKAGGKIEATKLEGRDNSAGRNQKDKGLSVQMGDTLVREARVNTEESLEIVRIQENEDDLAQQQLSTNQMENSLEHALFQIPLQIVEPKEEWYPPQLPGSVLLKWKEEEHKNQELEMICYKSQPVQTLDEMVSHQGVVEGHEMVNSGATENSKEKEVLQIEDKVPEDAEPSPSSAITLRDKGKGEVIPIRSNPRRGTRNGSK
ncbi:hypothetical protein KY285_001249 [Solanum tuberosum]|nr:hypothetical protein KY285_001249 [Solanum tuberosum]